MTQAYGPLGLKQYDKAVSALEMVIASRKETANLYAQLAILAAGAKQDRKSTLAEAKALALSPKAQRKQLKSAIDLQKSQLNGPAAGPSKRLTGPRRYHSPPRPCSSTGRAADS